MQAEYTSFRVGQTHQDTIDAPHDTQTVLSGRSLYKISQVRLVYSNKEVIGIQFWYKFPNGMEVQGKEAIGNEKQNRRENRIILQNDEFITEVYGREGSIIDNLRLKTNKGQIIEGGGDGGIPFLYTAKSGQHFGGFHIKMGLHIHQIFSQSSLIPEITFNYEIQPQYVHLLNIRKAVVIVGGGPVGLWTANLIRIMSLDDQLSIIVIEKRTDYVREHLLCLKKKSFEVPEITTSNPHYQRFQELIKSLSGKVPTKLIEQKLNEFAIENKIEILKGIYMSNIQDIYNIIPRSKIVCIVGADGRRSSVRMNILPFLTQQDHKNYPYTNITKPLVYVTTLQERIWSYRVLRGSDLNLGDLIKPKLEYEQTQNTIKERVFLQQLIVKYKVHEPKELDPLDAYKTLKLMPFPCQEVIGKKKDPVSGAVDITTIFVVSNEVAALIGDWTPASPGKFGDLERDSRLNSLKDSVSIWFNAKKLLVDQHVLPHSEKLTNVPISVYASTNLADVVDGQRVFVVGDAAFGVPYFRALNNGFLSSNFLSKCIVKMVQNLNDQTILQRQMDKYISHMTDFIYSEFAKAYGKTSLYKASIWFIGASGKVPWDFVKWWESDFKKQLLKTFDSGSEEETRQSIQQLKSQKDNILDILNKGLSDLFDFKEYQLKSDIQGDDTHGHQSKSDGLFSFDAVKKFFK